MKRTLKCLVILSLLLTPIYASAQLYGTTVQESPRGHQLVLKWGGYTPDIDSESNISAYQQAFGTESMLMFRMEYDYQFYKEFGSAAIAFEWGYGSVTGNGLLLDGETKSSDETSLTIMPVSLGIVYAFDVLAERWKIPFVPEFEFGLDLNFWWITNGVGETATDVIDGKTRTADGDTFGWHVSFTLKLLLDNMAPGMAQTFDVEMGVNNTYLFAEILYTDLSDFGSDRSWQIGDLTGMFGIAFEF